MKIFFILNAMFYVKYVFFLFRYERVSEYGDFQFKIQKNKFKNLKINDCD